MERAKVNRTKRATSIRLTDDAREILERLAKSAGISQSAVLELLLRDADKRGAIISSNKQQS